MSTRSTLNDGCGRTGRPGTKEGAKVRVTVALALALAIMGASWSAAPPQVIEAQLQYQRSRIEANRLERLAQRRIGSALPAGEYAWSMDFRCVTHESCVEAFGFPLLAPWQESFTFAAHLTSDGKRMHYTGANIYRGRAGAGELGNCEDPGAIPFSGVCVVGETAEVFVMLEPANPTSPSSGRPWLWVRGALQYAPLSTGGNRVIACACGGDGVATPTIALPGTLDTAFFAGGREVPEGVEMTVQLVKLP